MVYIAQDAAGILGRSLESVRAIADEIVVVDGGSRDRTAEVARESGARVIVHPWPGFAAQRQFAVEAATHDWILMMDADEVLRTGATAAIQEILAAERPRPAYRLRRCSYFQGKPIRFGDWRHDEVIRLFDRSQGHYLPSETVHESWRTTGATGKILPVALEHYSYSSYAHLLEKTALYSRLGAWKLRQRGRTVRGYMPMGHAVAAFWRSYVWRLGVLDGVAGAAIAWTAALGAFMKYAMALEMQERDDRSP